MYLRTKREQFDSWPDTVLAAALKTDAPRVQQTTGYHLAAVYVSGGQLNEFGDLITEASAQSPSFGRRPETSEQVESAGSKGAARVNARRPQQYFRIRLLND